MKKPSLNFKFDAEKSDERLKELTLFISDRCCDDPTFGATKLNKILFFSDFSFFEATGKPVTGAEYMKLPHGPVPKRMVPIRKQLESAKHLAIKEVPKGQMTQKRPIALRKANLSLFTADQIACVDWVISQLRDCNATVVSAVSHQRAWRIAEEDASIPYEAAFLSDDGLTDYDINRTRELSTKYGWNT